eukprot:gene9050-7887_t
MATEFGAERLRFIRVDMGSMADVVSFARRHDVAAYDALVMTVGLLPSFVSREATADGLEADFAVSY